MKKLNRLFVGVLSLVLSASVLFVGMVLNKTKYVSAAVSAGESYSQRDEDGIVLSVEKVGIKSTGDDYMDGVSGYDASQEFYGSASYPFKSSISDAASLNVDNIKATDEAGNSYASGEYPKYYFKHIKDGDKSKTIYRSGDYIMLENSLKTQIVNGKNVTYYYNPTIDNSGEMAEGVLFSFGSYILGQGKTGTSFEGKETLLTNTAQAGDYDTNYSYVSDIQQINVSATLNGKQIILPVVRQYGSNNYQDFSFIVPQRAGYDGHYEFVVEYRHNQQFKYQTFSFDLVFESTYTEPETFGSGYSYATAPKLEMPISGQTYFELGSSEQYPTLTYDFSKYTLDYSHEANGIVTNYSYRRVATAGVETRYNLVCTITRSGEQTTKNYSLAANTTKAVLVFTEVGSYNFNYGYIYNGEENNMGFELQSNNMSIRGYELKYSKTGHSEAQMRYLHIAQHDLDNVALIVPNGYQRNIESIADQDALGVVYTIEHFSDLGDSYHTGVVASTSATTNPTQDALINTQIKAEIPSVNFKNAASTVRGALNAGLTEKSYQTTNQGGIWLSSNLSYVEAEFEGVAKDKLTDGSFYYYSTNLIDKDKFNLDGTEIPLLKEDSGVLRLSYTNTTTFNQTGYYLVFIKAKVDGVKNDFYQVFAFKYTNETTMVDVNAETFDSSNTSIGYKTAIGSGKFTKRNVKISWREPDVFERNITVKYYMAKNVYLTKDESKQNGSTVLSAEQLRQYVDAKLVQNGDILGAELSSGEGASYLIEATNEGEAKSYRSFSVDKTPIEGVNMYAVQARNSAINTVYSIQQDSNGDHIRLVNAISSVQSAIYWDDKLSGANITANYYFAPFVKTGSASVKANTNSLLWFTNGYSLGDETGPFKIEKPTNLYSTLTGANVLKNAGVYLFELTDEAGNSCKYLYILDDTEQYFRIKTSDGYYEGGAFVTQTSFVFTDTVSVEFGTHKAIEIGGSANAKNIKDMLTLFRDNATNQALSTAGYFVGSGNNANALRNLFDYYDGTTYLIVANDIFTAYNEDNKTQNPNGVKIAKINGVNPNVEVNKAYTIPNSDNSNGYQRKICVYGINQFGYSNKALKNDSVSYIWIEINDDHSLGKVYAQNDNAFSNETALRDNAISTGTNLSRILGAQATSDKLVAFYWTQGIGDYEVTSIRFTRYGLNTSQFNGDNYFYSTESTTTGELLTNRQQVTGAENRFYALVNVQSGQTVEGLYCITRVYHNDEKTAQHYYFIVDRQGIMEEGNGEYIHIKLKEETAFNGFNKIGLTTNTLSYRDNENKLVEDNLPYTISLETCKLPAQVMVPVGKFFNQVNASSYKAGRLNFALYYLSYETDLNVIKLFNTKEYNAKLSNDKQEEYYINNNYLIVNLEDYLSGEIKNKFLITDQGAESWLWLPGVYVFVVEDEVKSSIQNANKLAFGFKITNQSPSIDVYAVANVNDGKDKQISSQQNYTLTTNQEYVKFELPKYDVASTSAQVDQQYLLVKKSVNGGAFTTYINYEYGDKGGEAVLPDVDAESGNIVVSLASGIVYDANGNIDYNSSLKNVEYQITIRYRISSTGGGVGYDMKYAKCYRFINADGNLEDYYQTTYTVKIDRIPPTANTAYLEETDKLVDYYNQTNGTESMFEIKAHKSNAGLSFTNQYAKYHSVTSPNPAYLYAFIVDKNTTFDNSDCYAVYYREIYNIETASLQIPVVNFSNYNLAGGGHTYGEILSSAVNGNYYEIVEVDAAGNMSQYIVLYTPGANDGELSFTFGATYIGENGEIISTKTEEGDNGITLSSTQNTITVFDLYSVADNTIAPPQDKFFHITLNGAVNLTYNTNPSTVFTNSGLTAQICNAIKQAGFGVYTINVVSRINDCSYSVTINYYDSNNRVDLDASSLVNEARNLITFDAANSQVNGVMYYARQIDIVDGDGKTTSYLCDTSNFTYYFLDQANKKTYLEGLTLDDKTGTYQITLIDAFGETSKYRFVANSTKNDFHDISFGTQGKDQAYRLNGYYYAFSQANIKYDMALYKKVILSFMMDGKKAEYTLEVGFNGELNVKRDGAILVFSISYNNLGDLEIKDANGNNVEAILSYTLDNRQQVNMVQVSIDSNKNCLVTFLPFMQDNAGKKVEYSLELQYEQEREYVYHIVLDTSSNIVNLQNTDGVRREIEPKYNVDESEFANLPFDTTAGTMNLMWTPIENDYFTYTYILHERMADDSISTRTLSGSSYVINTTSNSKGVYWFEIRISTADGKYLGNKVYAFSVVAVLTDLYYVQTEDMEAIGANSSFKFKDFDNFNINLEGILKLNSETKAVLPIIQIPLYISNKALSVVVAEDQGAKMKSTDYVVYTNLDDGEQYAKLKVYRVYTNTYSRYFATLEFVKTKLVAKSFGYIKTSNENQTIMLNQSENMVYLNSNDNLIFTFKQNNVVTNSITSKNSVILRVYHNDVLLEEQVKTTTNLDIQYLIKGSGKYTFELRDLAGNKQIFTFDDNETESIDITVIKDIYFTMNDLSPVDNAVVNDPVTLAVLNPYDYDIENNRPVVVEAYRNGQAYSPIQKGYTYTFEDFGNYKVTFTAYFKEGEEKREIKTTINFTILNKNEARASYDLTQVSRYSITKVENQDGVDVTSEFMKMINPQLSESGRLLTYETLMKNAEQMQISAGKQSITVSYQVVDGIYPTRELSFTFTLNDEQPTIECSVEVGKTTTKGFDITFNPGMIYEQVGDAYIYINDMLVFEINETSSLAQTSFTLDQKTYGAGDYYVKLIGSSGNVITSFKVVVKEPLNVWAIIIIVVVSVIVVGVTITIILLRNKMRIR